MVPLTEGDRGHSVVDRILRGHPTLDLNSSDDSRIETVSRQERSPLLGQKEPASQAKEEMKKENLKSEISQHEHTSEKSSIVYTDAHYSSNPTQRENNSPVDEISKLEYYIIHDDILNEVRGGRYKISIAPSDLIDFGGQRSYDMTHQLFIHHSGSFVLMFDGLIGLDTPLREYPNGKTTAACKYYLQIESIILI
ncbi:unnamed protein product [Mytilus coruscus]|uniref:Uncharacterized protein n=1 Tax=Mytilus coruscus TaxID=42192 RepID=A0A6J8BF93_MYTCO|nr:unnamed protein product [Mytilus coruscus]